MVTVDSLGDVPIAYVRGEIDCSKAPELRERLQAASHGRERFVISFEKCDYCDSSGIIVLLEFQKRFNRQLAFVAPRDSRFLRTLDVLGLRALLQIFETATAAVEHLNAFDRAGSEAAYAAYRGRTVAKNGRSAHPGR